MTKPGNWLHAAPLAVVALTLLALPSVAAAQTQPPSPQTKAAKSYPKRHAAATRQRQNNGEPPGCTWPYQNRFPPCMSTWPQGSPSYHGPVPGVTFGDEY